MLTNSINTFTQTLSITPLKVIRSTGCAVLATLTLPIFIISHKPFDFFKKKEVEVWGQNTNFSKNCETILEEWVAETPIGENRTVAQKKIQNFLSLNQTDLSLSKLNLTSLPDIFNDLRFNRLENLDLMGNHLETLPESFGNLHALQKLDLIGNHLETLPVSFSNLHALQWLRLAGNHLEALPESFGNLHALQWLRLAGNRLETLPVSFDSLHALQKLDLMGNHLETLPESFGNLHALRELHLSGNRLETLPESFGNLHALRELNLEGNPLETLPESFGNLHALQKLDLIGDRLETLPVSFSNLHALQWLRLADNRLETLPESIGQLQALTSLRLDNNPFNGITDAILQLSSNCTIDLTGCNLSRAILERLRERMNLPDYRGPRISYSIVDRTSITEKSIEDSLRELYQIIDKEPTTFANLPETEELRSWLNRLVDTADYKNEILQKAFAEKIIDYLNEANENTEFRRIFEATIQDASATCGDRVALSVLHLSIAYQLATIDFKNMKQLDHVLTKGSWTIDLLEKIARDKILDLPFFDEIEVYLGYPIKLKQELDIPIDVQEMLYFSCSALKPKDLQEAKNIVLNKQKNQEEHLEFLITNAKWQEALSVNYSKEYKSILDERTKATELDNPDYSNIEKKYKQDLKALTLTALANQ